MSRHRGLLTRVARMVLRAGVCLGPAGVAVAAPADYRCADGQVLTVDFTPRTAQARLGPQAWTLQRVRSGREARYVGRDGVAIVLRRSDAELQRRDAPPLACRLVLRSPEAGASPRPAR
ncbi:MliC family protein [Ideonella sp.]|uniref:MliC family protein n=1 Tax=Ideonella sp. TaxID=1929293 RepID=UPI0035B01AA4